MTDDVSREAPPKKKPRPPHRHKRAIFLTRKKAPPTLEELLAQGPELERAPAAKTPWLPLQPPRRENFAQLYASGMTARAAYTAAGFTSKRTDKKVEIKDHVDVAARVAWIQEQKAKAFHEEARTAYCAQIYEKPLAMAEAEDVRRMAMELKRPSAAMHAIIFKARISDLLKQQDDGLGMPLHDMSIEQLEKMRVSFGRELRDLKSLLSTVDAGDSPGGTGEDGRSRGDPTITQH